MLNNILKNKLFKTCSALVFGLACISSITLLQKSKLKDLDIAKSIDTYRAEEQAELAKLNLFIKAPSLGFDNLISSYTMLKFINYFGDEEARQQIGYDLNSKYLETIVEKDPMFTKAQFIISPMVTLKQGNPEETVALLDKSLSKLSPIIHSQDSDKIYKPNFLWVQKAIDELLFLGDAEAATESYKMAAEWSSILGDTTREKSARQTVEFLSKNPNSKQVQVGAWFSVWVGAPDEETREIARANIESLGGELKIYDDGRVQAIPPQENNS